MNLGVFFSLDGEELTGVSWNFKTPAGFGHTLSRFARSQQWKIAYSLLFMWILEYFSLWMMKNWRECLEILKRLQVSATLCRDLLHVITPDPFDHRAREWVPRFLQPRSPRPGRLGGLRTRIHSSVQLPMTSSCTIKNDNVNKVFGHFWGTQNWPYRFHGKYKSQFVLNRILQRRRQLKVKKIYIKINKTLLCYGNLSSELALWKSRNHTCRYGWWWLKIFRS